MRRGCGAFSRQNRFSSKPQGIAFRRMVSRLRKRKDVVLLPEWDGPAVRRPDLAVTTPRGLWVALSYWSFLAAFSLAAATPHRAAGDTTRAPSATEYADSAD
jgi:hypothetical protein